MYKTNFHRLQAYPLAPEKTVHIGDKGQYAKKTITKWVDFLSNKDHNHGKNRNKKSQKIRQAILPSSLRMCLLRHDF